MTVERDRWALHDLAARFKLTDREQEAVEHLANADAHQIPGLHSLNASGEITVAVFLLLILTIRPRGLLGKAA